jgi:hypothetical protein
LSKAPKAGAAEVGELDLHATGADLVDEGQQEGVDAVTRVEGRVDEVDADGAQGVLLAARVLVPETQVEDDLAGLGARLILKADPDPGDGPALCRHGGSWRPCPRRRTRRVTGPRSAFQAVDAEAIFVVEHLLETLARRRGAAGDRRWRR